MAHRRTLPFVVVVVLAAARAQAQDVPPDVRIGAEQPDEKEAGTTAAIDLSNIVTSAAKGVTTVQEAPAIVTIITARDIQQFGYRTLEDILADVPGWFRYDTEGETFPDVTTRGVLQSMLLLRDGVPLLDPFANTAAITRSIPLESIKRIEVVTGPGGVLWGANSFLGIANIITKDAEDVSGVEASAGYGDGRGNRSDFRTYLMTGTTLWGGRAKVFAHASYENYVGQELTASQFLAGSIPPEPSGTAIYGPAQTSDAARSWVLSVDGKMTAGPLSLYWAWVDGRLGWAGTFSQGVTQQSVPNQNPLGPNMTTDARSVARQNVINRYDRYAILQYRGRPDDSRFSIDAKAYLVESMMQFDPLVFFPASTLVPGGVVGRMASTPSPFRAGVTVDADLRLPHSSRLYWGGEAFREWADTSTLEFLSPDPSQSPGTNRLPFACPHLTSGSFAPMCPTVFAFAASREVAAAYLAGQMHVLPTLMLDAGARVQDGFGERAYDALMLFSGSAAWQFVPDWHLKANFSQGFRPPVFNDTNSNGAGAEFGGNPNIKNEFSNSVQGELNARVLRNVNHVREFTMRADYSYTVLDNTIVVQNGQYANSGRRGISSGEFLGRLYLRGDHDFELGYTFLQMIDEAKGQVLATPNHWFTLKTSFNLLANRLFLVSTLLLAGAAEDPNRLPHPNSACVPGMPPSCGGDAPASSIALDRIPAVALWNVGLRVRGLLGERVDLDAFAYNILDQHWYQQDGFYDLNPTTETQPAPGFGFSFFSSIRVHY